VSPRAEAEALNRSESVTASQKHRDPRFPPYAFTEHDLAIAVILWAIRQPMSLQRLRILIVARAVTRRRDETT
jgi:hypothetical protein